MTRERTVAEAVGFHPDPNRAETEALRARVAELEAERDARRDALCGLVEGIGKIRSAGDPNRLAIVRNAKRLLK